MERIHPMRSYIASTTLIAGIACCMLVLEGCYGYSALKDEGYAEAPQEEEILVHRKHGQDTRLEPHHFIEVREPSNFVYGVGERAGKDSSHYVPFCGKIHPIARKTQTFSAGDIGPQRATRLIFTLQDSSIVRMEEPDCIVVDSARGTGLWYVINQRNGSDRVGSERISFDDIKSIEVKKFSTVNTATCVLGVAAVAGVADLLINFLKRLNFSIDPGKGHAF